MLKSNFLLDVIEIEKLAKILEELDIKEDIPKASRNFDYKSLTAPDIRTMNKIVEYMEEHDIEDIDEFIGKGNISIIEVISSDRKEDIKIVNADVFLKTLIEKSLVEDELSEGLQIFLAVSVDNLDILMIRKIRKWVKDFKRVKFFKYFGTKFREEDSVITEADEDETPINFEDALRSSLMFSAPIVEHKGKKNPKLK